MFRAEVLFGMYTINRQSLYNTYFSPDIQQPLRLSFNAYDDSEVRLDWLFDDKEDYRRDSWIILKNPTGSYLTHVKFAVAPYNVSQNLMPLIRLSELILMAAECSNTLEEGKAYLNMLRLARNAVDLNPANATQLKEFITREFRKEVVGEGQMFFYFKRNAMTTIPTNVWGDPPAQTKSISLLNYVVPLPASEVSIRGN
jgi:starch-binding outer membrane protein, SusD/RagB family